MSINRPYEEKEMLRLIADGDQQAFRKVYDTYKERLFLMAHHTLQSRVQAQDALQEVFIKVWVNRDKLPGIQSLEAWLVTVTRNLLYDKLREQTGLERSLDPATEEALEAYADHTFREAEFRELVVLVERAKRRLSPQQQRVFELSRLQGMKHREIAEEMGLSTETVKKYVMDALKNVQDFLRRHGKQVSVILLLQLFQA